LPIIICIHSAAFALNSVYKNTVSGLNFLPVYNSEKFGCFTQGL